MGRLALVRGEAGGGKTSLVRSFVETCPDGVRVLWGACDPLSTPMTLAPFQDIGARKNIIESIGSTDHLNFIAAGVPGFNPVQEYTNYDVRIHHTNMDTMDRMNPDDVKEAAVVFATFAYNAAMRDAMMPRQLQH